MQGDKGNGPLYALLIVGAGLFMAAPAVILGFPQITDDAQVHAVWYEHFAEQLWAGDLYPRWLSGLNGGLGSPVFFFYPPASYYLTSVWRLLLPGDQYGWRQLGISSAVALVASGLSAYFWLTRIVDRRSASFGALVYMAAPYHLAVDLYTRGAFAEFWGFVWMPLTLRFAARIAERARFAVVGLAISYALLVTTHLPTAVIFFLVPPAYAAFTADAGRRLRALSKAAGAMALGVGLAAVYLTPALTTQGNIKIAEMRIGFFHYGNWFLFASPKLWGGVTGKLSAMVVTVAGIACGAFALTRMGASERGKEGAFWLAAAGLSIFMMTPLSALIWKALPPLQALQFPYRFNTLLTAATAALCALALSALKGVRDFKVAGVLAICSVLAAAWVAATAWAAWSAFPLTNPARYETSSVIKELDFGRDAPEYQPAWASAGTIEREFERFTREPGGENRSAVRVVEGSASVTAARWRPGMISLQTDAAGGAQLVVRQFYYPGWTARADDMPGDESRLDVRPSVPDGLLSLRVPSGRHTVSLRLEPTLPERAGRVLSVIAVLITAILLVYALRSRSESDGGGVPAGGE